MPCKFFKVDACTAGASCPFAHIVGEPGKPKDVCTWFVKGNCKFGHKCALAHLLPGQPMSMDRKNKKAAQQATGSGGGGGGGAGKGERSRRGGRNRSRERGDRAGGAPPGLSRPPLTISKALGPSTAAPPVQDTDFGFDLPHDEAFVEVTPARPAPAQASADVLSAPPGLGPPGLTLPPKATTTVTAPSAGPATPSDTPVRPPPLPLSTPSSGRATRAAGDYGFGPIGSPPRSSPSGRINGFSPGTSPTYSSAMDNNGFPSSLSVPKASLLRPAGPFDQGLRNATTGWGAPAVAVDDEDLEEALPSSLNELLTDNERERRWSRTAGTRPTIDSLHHRYSRSVPATTWMDGVAPPTAGSVPKWTDAGGDIMPGTSLGTTTGTLGMSLSPSNASGAFLGRPGLRALSANPPPTSHSFDGAFEDDRDTVGAMASPGARALASFAPGQSLPQGLAAGASRIHMMAGADWARSPPGFGAATGRSVSTGAPPPVQQRRSDKWVMSSPLAGPVITNNDPDDGLFVMD